MERQRPSAKTVIKNVNKIHISKLEVKQLTSSIKLAHITYHQTELKILLRYNFKYNKSFKNHLS